MADQHGLFKAAQDGHRPNAELVVDGEIDGIPVMDQVSGQAVDILHLTTLDSHRNEHPRLQAVSCVGCRLPEGWVVHLDHHGQGAGGLIQGGLDPCQAAMPKLRCGGLHEQHLHRQPLF